MAFDDPTLRRLLEPFGPLKAQPAADWLGADALPDAVAEFYARVGPLGQTHHENAGPVGCTLTVGGNPVCIPALRKLWTLQDGYAWSRTPENTFSGWSDDWLVIAEQGGDPFIFERSTGHVLFAFHGAGSWKPRQFAPDLRTAIGALAVVATGFCALTDEHFVDEEPTPQALAQIKTALAAALGDMQQADEMLAAWGYYR